MSACRQFYTSLYTTDNRSFYLSVLRTGISLWLIKEMMINWPSFGILYGPNSFVDVSSNKLLSLVNLDVQTLRSHYLPLTGIYAVLLLLNLLGIGRNLTAILVFLFTEMFFRMNIYLGNGGIHLCRFILLYLCIGNSYRYFTLFKRKKPRSAGREQLSVFFTNMSAYSIMCHLCIAYLVSAIIKVQSPVWQQGTAVYNIFASERFNGTGYNNQLAHYGWLMKGFAWYTLVFEFTFPILVWIKKIRTVMVIMGILFHAGIYYMMMIYGFQEVFLLTYGLFYTNKNWQNLLKKLRINIAPAAV